MVSATRPLVLAGRRFESARLPLDELNPVAGPAAEASARLDLETPDASDDDLFNRILWRATRGDTVPYPEPKRVSVKELTLAR